MPGSQQSCMHSAEPLVYAESTESLDCFRYPVNGFINLLILVGATYGEADGVVGSVFPEAQGRDHVRRLDRGRRAGRAGGERDGIVEFNDQRTALDAGDGHVEVVREAVDGMTVERQLAEAFLEPCV